MALLINNAGKRHGIDVIAQSVASIPLRFIEATCFDVLTLRTLSRTFGFYFKGVRHANT